MEKIIYKTDPDGFKYKITLVEVSEEEAMRVKKSIVNFISNNF